MCVANCRSHRREGNVVICDAPERYRCTNCSLSRPSWPCVIGAHAPRFGHSRGAAVEPRLIMALRIENDPAPDTRLANGKRNTVPLGITTFSQTRRVNTCVSTGGLALMLLRNTPFASYD